MTKLGNGIDLPRLNGESENKRPNLESWSQKASLENSRRNAFLIKEATAELSHRQAPPSLKETNHNLKDLVKDRPDNGKKLLALGTALLIAPDPITDVAAVPVLIAGKAMQARHAIGVKNVYEEMRHTLNQISSICSL